MPVAHVQFGINRREGSYRERPFIARVKKKTRRCLDSRSIRQVQQPLELRGHIPCGKIVVDNEVVRLDENDAARVAIKPIFVHRLQIASQRIIEFARNSIRHARVSIECGEL